MRLYWSATPGASNLTESPTPTSNQHGWGANLGDLRTRSYWTDTADRYLGFSTTNWDLVTVESRGYPILKGLDGRALGGL
jgi:hypothetical protein